MEVGEQTGNFLSGFSLKRPMKRRKVEEYDDIKEVVALFVFLLSFQLSTSSSASTLLVLINPVRAKLQKREEEKTQVLVELKSHTS